MIIRKLIIKSIIMNNSKFEEEKEIEKIRATLKKNDMKVDNHNRGNTSPNNNRTKGQGLGHQQT